MERTRLPWRPSAAILALLLCAPLAAKSPKDETAAATKTAEGERQDSERAKKRAPIVVTAQRYERPLFDQPRSAVSYDAENLHEVRLVRTMPEALRETPGISVQKTSHSQGSPKIRGQNGYRTLLLVDGIRVNNSIWRSGNVEYWNTVDAFSLERLEVVRGPGSVLYGSDAAFGVGQAFSRGPGDPSTWEGESEVRGRLHLRYASAEDSYIGRAEARGHVGGQFGWHAGFTFKDFGDMVAGADMGRLPQTGYDEIDGDVKLNYALAENMVLGFGFQHVEWDDANRTHSTVFAKPWRSSTAGSDFHRYYSQQRDLAYARLNIQDEGFSQEYTLSYQLFEEGENRLRSNSRRRVQGATVDQFGVAARYLLDIDPDTKLAFGLEAYHEEVESEYTEYNADGSIREVRNRGAIADDAYYQSFGIYAEATRQLDEQWEVTAGARYSYYEADADTVAVSGSSVPASPLHRSWNSIVGSTQILYRANETTRFWGSIAQSFRAPNLADLTRFDAALSNDIEVPTVNLDPEKYLTFEVGGRYDDGLRRVGGSFFYTRAEDLITRFPTGNVIGGMVEVNKANASDGYFVGFELEAATVLDFLELDEWEAYAFVDHVDASVDSFEPGDPAETHPKGIPPMSAQLGFRWQHPTEETRFEVFFPMVASYDSSSYNAAERRDTQRLPPDGYPGYVLVGMRGSTRIHEKVLASVSVENLTNVDYRVVDSGNNGLGTNVILSLILDL